VTSYHFHYFLRQALRFRRSTSTSFAETYRAAKTLLAEIEAPLVIERILRHLGLWDPRPPSQNPPEEDDWPVNGQIPLTYEPSPAIA